MEIWWALPGGHRSAPEVEPPAIVERGKALARLSSAKRAAVLTLVR